VPKRSSRNAGDRPDQRDARKCDGIVDAGSQLSRAEPGAQPPIQEGLKGERRTDRDHEQEQRQALCGTRSRRRARL